MTRMSRTIVVIVGVSLAVGCKAKRDETCERAVDIAIKCDVGVSGKNHEVEPQFRDNMLDICKEAFADPEDSSAVTKETRQEVRAYAECKAKAEDCEGYWRCEAVLQRNK